VQYMLGCRISHDLFTFRSIKCWTMSTPINHQTLLSISHTCFIVLSIHFACERCAFSRSAFYLLFAFCYGFCSSCVCFPRAQRKTPRLTATSLRLHGLSISVYSIMKRFSRQYSQNFMIPKPLIALRAPYKHIFSC
jgi:hypothetical protein